MTGQQLVLTPEKTLVSYTIASFGSRILAGLLDLFFYFMVVSTFSVLAVYGSMILSQEVSMAILTLVSAFGLFLYFILQDCFCNGQTLGKRLMSLRVMMADGTPITASAAIYRGLLIPADLMPGIPLVGMIAMFLNTRSQRLGDLAAGTMVVHTPKMNFGFTPAPHRYGLHPLEAHVGELKDMKLEEYLAIKRLCDRFPDLPPTQQVKSIEEIWSPFARRMGIPYVPNVHPIYLMEAAVMKYGRLNNLV